MTLMFSRSGEVIGADASAPAAQSLAGVTEVEVAKAKIQKEEGARQAILHVEQGREMLKARRFRRRWSNLLSRGILTPPIRMRLREELKRYVI